ncbi:hypothetical protein HKCCSP123_11520 [Rhodobacterales bacterium HKCCSP123]|nr:hypothetical protein [Rhodobacterales bacterium HKCCSP123]
MWLRIVLNDPDVGEDDILSGDEVMTAALHLARAEASLVAAEGALLEFERGTAPPSDVAKTFFEERKMLLDWMNEFEIEGLMTEDDREHASKLLRQQGLIIHRETSIGGERHKLLQLYARRARRRREKAFHAWLDISAALGANLKKRSQSTTSD